MRNVKEITIDGRDKPVTVRELRVKDILRLFGEDKDTPAADLTTVEGLKSALDLAADISLDELKELAPSEIKVIYDAFREVNGVFFDAARALGLDRVLGDLKTAIVTDFAKRFAA